jgi:hypothetical protein
MTRSKLFAAVALVAGLIACEEETDAPEFETFTATLTGDAERPTPVVTTTTGTAFFTVAGPTLLYRIDIVGVDSVTQAHIHAPADTGGFTGVRVNLCSSGPAPACAPTTAATFTGVLTSGATVDVTGGFPFDSLLVWMRTGRAYVNVHTSENTGGEVRGQIVPQ